MPTLQLYVKYVHSTLPEYFGNRFAGNFSKPYTSHILEVVLVLVDTCESVLSQVFFSHFKTSLFQFPFKTFKRGHSIYGEQKQKTVQGR